ncbi:MAG TPA: ABC transporter substrate-binding protein [Nocardioidaceae bacterium]|nr:ABC transporter substrate-binding protein [Nocardioidaceae bacterium]
MKTRARGVGIVLTALSLALVTGCGRDSTDGDNAAVPGVTSEPCPQAVDQEKGCIYLGVITDLTGVFKLVGGPVTEGQKAFWAKVNAEGGIGDYEIDVVTNVKDNAYNPDTHASVYAEIEDKVLGLAQSLGTAHTNGILEDVQDASILTQPTSLGSNWIFEGGVTEIGTNYCAEAMNIVDYAVDELGAKSIAAVHYAGDYGDDNMVGARIAAEARDIEFTDIPIEVQVEESQAAAVGAIKRAKPDVVVIATGPTDLAAVVGLSAVGGFTGKFIGAIPSWNSALLASEAGPAITALYMQATSFGTWESDTAGHEAMRAAAGKKADPNDWYMIGWAGQYVMKAALEAAIEADDLTREGLVAAGEGLTGVSGDGMLPEGSGNYAGDPNERVVRSTSINKVDAKAASGVSTAAEAFTGPTVEAYEFTEPCYLQK